MLYLPSFQRPKISQISTPESSLHSRSRKVFSGRLQWTAQGYVKACFLESRVSIFAFKSSSLQSAVRVVMDEGMLSLKCLSSTAGSTGSP